MLYSTIHAVLASYLQCHFLCLFQGFSVRQVELKRESSSVYVTLGFAGIAMVAAMLVGVVVLKRRNGRHPHHQVRPKEGHLLLIRGQQGGRFEAHIGRFCLILSVNYMR